MLTLGIINIIFGGIFTLFLVSKYKNFDWDKLTFSDLGEDPKLGKWFNLFLIIFSLNQLIFSVQVCLVVMSQLAPIFIFGGVLLGFAGLITTRKHHLLHAILADGSGLIVAIGVFVLAIKIIQSNLLLGSFILLVTIFMPVSMIIQAKRPGAKWESVIFVCVGLWNVLLTVASYLS